MTEREKSPAYKHAELIIDVAFGDLLQAVHDAIKNLPVDEQRHILIAYDIFDDYDTWLYGDDYMTEERS